MNTRIRIAIIIALVTCITNSGVMSENDDVTYFAVDTLLKFDYADTSCYNMTFGLPEFFAVGNEMVYVFFSKGNVLTFDKNARCINNNALPCENPDNVVGIVAYDSGLAYIEANRICLLDQDFRKVDSVTCDFDLWPGPRFYYNGKIYFQSLVSSQFTKQFDIATRSFHDTRVTAIWGVQSENCIVNPFRSKTGFCEIRFSGASRKLIVASSCFEKRVSLRRYYLFNAEKCEKVVLNGFEYQVKAASDLVNYFQFVNDTTAIFREDFFTDYKYDQVEGGFVLYKVTFKNI